MSRDYLTEDEFKEFNRASFERTPYYAPVVIDFDLKTSNLPKVWEGRRYRVVAPCKATICLAVFSHNEGYEEIVLREGLSVVAEKVYAEDALAFRCKPLEPEKFIADYLPESCRASPELTSHISVSIFRYHIGVDLEEIA
jgi:hypothetical protein